MGGGVASASGQGIVCVCVGGGESTSENRPSKYNYQSPKQFL